MGRVALVADDDSFFRLALREILTRRLGFERVREASGLDEALEIMGEDADVTLALFDLAMPGMSGAASLSAVRECHPGVTVAVVSGSKDREDVLAAIAAGVHGFVPKADGVDVVAKALAMVDEGWIYVPRFVTEPPPARDGTDGPPPPLTARQTQVLAMIVDGLSNKEIARELKLGDGTVKVHVAAVLRALGVSKRSAAAAQAGRYAEIAK